MKQNVEAITYGPQNITYDPKAPFAIIGQSDAAVKLREETASAANEDGIVVILGPPGSGKYLVAREIHQQSERHGNEFMHLHCGNIPKDLAEDTLFGHVKGAYTGATEPKKGYFGIPGTLFIDELGVASQELQEAFLSGFDNNEYSPIGSTESVPIQPRILFAANENLKLRRDLGVFRVDLYDRLGNLFIEVPFLRDRPEDIPDLVHYFVAKFTSLTGKTRLMYEHPNGVPDEVMEKYQARPWRGNVRQLEGTVEAAVRRGSFDGTDYDIGHAFERLPVITPIIVESDGRNATGNVEGEQQAPESTDKPTSVSAAIDEALARGEIVDIEKEQKHAIEEALERTGGNQVRAAKLLGLTRGTLRYRLDKYGIGS